MALVLIVYDPRIRATVGLAEALAGGVARAGAVPRLRAIGTVEPGELELADALALGTPNWTGVTGMLKTWLDAQGELWERQVLRGKVGAAFVTAYAPAAGLEFTLWSLLHWMLANGMVVVGLPWSESMRTGGSYYGASAAGPPNGEELARARELGRRVALAALRLTGPERI